MSEEPSMPLIRPAALSAAELAAQEAAAAEAAARDALVAAARSCVEALPAPDGTKPLLGKLKDDKTAPAVHVDMDRGWVVLSDGDVDLSVYPERGEVRLAELINGGWTRRSEPVTDLAQLGRLIDEAGT